MGLGGCQRAFACTTSKCCQGSKFRFRNTRFAWYAHKPPTQLGTQTTHCHTVATAKYAQHLLLLTCASCRKTSAHCTCGLSTWVALATQLAPPPAPRSCSAAVRWGCGDALCELAAMRTAHVHPPHRMNVCSAFGRSNLLLFSGGKQAAAVSGGGMGRAGADLDGDQLQLLPCIARPPAMRCSLKRRSQRGSPSEGVRPAARSLVCSRYQSAITVTSDGKSTLAGRRRLLPDNRGGLTADGIPGSRERTPLGCVASSMAAGGRRSTVPPPCCHVT